jgi:hypothetical protein
MTELSPAAQAVLDAFTEDNCLHDWKHNHYNIEALAAALRAAADQVVPKDVDPSGDWTDKDEVRYQLFAIATELEVQFAD